jgi:hypothetical protein
MIILILLIIDKPVSDGKICHIPFKVNESQYYHCGYSSSTNQCIDKNGDLFKCNLGKYLSKLM